MAHLSRTRLTVAAGLGAAVLWSYWPLLGDMVARWGNDPKYAHGYLVPVFALWLLWRRLRRAGPPPDAATAGDWWGLALLAGGLGLHLAGAYVYFAWLSEVSFLFTLAALVLAVGGWRLLRIAGPSIGFLAFMLPLPYQVEFALGTPLQHLAAQASAYLLELLGLCASAQGSTIALNSRNLEVVEACSGLGMVVTFFALCTAAAIVINRPLLDRVVVVVSAVPVALIANIARITVTGILAETVGGPVADVVYHDAAGYLMMSFAALLIWVELLILSRLLVPVPATDDAALDIKFAMPAAPTVAARRRKVAVDR
jgi:exosortase